jgi:hypothetical protein
MLEQIEYVTVKAALSEELGVGLRRKIRKDYSEWVALFGEPNVGPSMDGKTQVEWWFKLDGELVAIWDYKEDVAPEQVTHWSVYARRDEMLDWLEQA